MSRFFSHSSWLNHLDQEEEGEGDQDDGCYPGDDVEDGSIRILSHQFLIIDEQEHEDEYERQNDPIDDL